MFLKFFVLTIILTAKFVRSEMDDYIKESRQECKATNDIFPCTKYRTLRYLTTLGDYYYSSSGNDTSPVRIVKMERLYDNGPDFFPTARQSTADTEFTKFVKFVQRQANYYLGTQGLAFNLPEGAEVIENSLVEEGRGKKKKVTMILLPLIILFKLFKIKLMLAIVLASVLFIKKAVLLAAIILPTALQYLKQCSHGRQPHHFHPTPYHHFEHDDHEEPSYGGYGYGKDYDRAYNGYVKSRHGN
ncbi:hypothetical protein PPYR_11340 [Photinus pyralis]|uniref:Uncharacterized protein n=1 Tax=Photinus pyralis TaxID=7054 RepID=A0A5N4AB14_PHOPY|nr:uncharacterized protein LOC116177290 [Photinus pyralis]KAB0794501.1 hypothetical protein PPYR_11340 [Photinus pyralis]